MTRLQAARHVPTDISGRRSYSARGYGFSLHGFRFFLLVLYSVFAKCLSVGYASLSGLQFARYAIDFTSVILLDYFGR